MDERRQLLQQVAEQGKRHRLSADRLFLRISHTYGTLRATELAEIGRFNRNKDGHVRKPHYTQA